MIISIIAAMAKNRVIGRDGAIPWNVPEDLLRFRKLTMGHPIIMGRKTYEQIGRPLPGRLNIILTRRSAYRAPGCLVRHSLADALAVCGAADEVFICGGGEIYRQTIGMADRIYLTIIDGEPEGDVLFPAIPADFVEKEHREGIGGFCTFILYQRKPG
ncbi:MAG TPA: dihydrofolate reductase [Geobacteraceae bacterium]|nr:dihydrofolate reductase [Geobacteraceae bacterium]